MTLTAAPFYADACPLGDNGLAYWATTSDAKRIRLAVWAKDADRGTVLLFPGRTEYVEKYAAAAVDFEERGYATIAIDWRGQGLADRMLDDPRVGHVDAFEDYQKDVATLLQTAEALELPKPYYLVGHSMGGAIGLRALMEGLPVNAAVFSAPMWGVQIAPHLLPMAWGLGHLMPAVGLGHKNPPGTTLESYVLNAQFEDNTLTTDRPMFDMMRDQLVKYPALGLGGPSYTWLRESLSETKALSTKTSPNTPTITFLGTNERIVRNSAVHERMEKWPNGSLEMVQSAEHEIMMEGPETRKDAFDQMAELFKKHS